MADQKPTTPADEKVTNRGFVHWEPIVPRSDRGDGTDTVRFYESSGAASIRGTLDNPVIIEGPFAWLAVGDSTAHLTAAEVARLHDYTGRWLQRHNPEAAGD
ncbi:hypothetical protein ACIA5H_37095 [Nocardia sp. NPDC051900]|uniref:hypothetical protein n=1 Tax=Nocardia sp. NPDC051900 TaxID=3364326 RepID=UPI00378FAE4A